MIKNLKQDLRKNADAHKKKTFQNFFKMGPGQYGEGDIFLGVTVPHTREITKKYRNIPFSQVKILLNSKIHEERLAAILILVYNYETGSENIKKKNSLSISCQFKKDQQLGSR